MDYGSMLSSSNPIVCYIQDILSTIYIFVFIGVINMPHLHGNHDVFYA